MDSDPRRAPPGDEPPHGRPNNPNVGLWAGLGCLGVLLLSCCLFAYWAQANGFRWVLNQGDEVRSSASRGLISVALQGIAATCTDGAPAEDVSYWFHPDVPSGQRSLLCGVDEVTLQQILSAEQTPSRTLTALGQQPLAAEFGMDPDHCYRYTTETVSVVGCLDTGPDAGPLPYRIIDVSSTAASN
ncbi:MAG: hypothetical protein AAF997_00105 [Myxococcota bacterium]